MFIQEVGLKNYQAHKNTVVQFINGDNAIIGASDSGKTALKRAVECVLYNDHSGVDYIKEGEDAYSVYVLFSDGTKITRERGKKRINRYIIEKGEDKLVLENFGKNVPEEVTQAHKMYKVKIGKKMDSLFSAKQLDGPFFLQNTPEERGAIISSIAKTEVVDEAVNITLSDLRDQKKEKKTLEKVLKEDRQTLENFSYLAECEKILEEIRRDMESLEKIRENLVINTSNFERVNCLRIKKAKQEAIIGIFSDIEFKIKEFEILSSKSREVDKLKNDFGKLLRALDEQKYLINKIENLQNTDNNLQQCNILLDKKKDVNNLSMLYYKVIKLKEQSSKNKIKQEKLQYIDTTLNNIEDVLIPKVNKYNNLLKTYKEYKELNSRKENGINFISNKNKQINQKIEEYEQGLLSLGKCPICFNDVSAEKVRKGLIS